MKLRLASICAAALFAGAATAASAAAAGDCNRSVSSKWQAKPGVALGVEASSQGPSCAKAAVVIVIRSSRGGVLWTDSAPAEHVMVFSGVKSPDEMAKALNEWISSPQQYGSSSDLAEWKQGAEQPIQGEFVFYPDAGIDRAYYEKLRAAKLPVFSYVQGMESLAVLVLMEDGRLEKIGAQSFPG